MTKREEELAAVIRDSVPGSFGVDAWANNIARAILAAGYLPRAEVLEEAASLVERIVVNGPEDDDVDHDDYRDMQIAQAIRALSIPSPQDSSPIRSMKDV